MRKLHQNIFYYYRGPNTDNRSIEIQLENNTTKALINVLENLRLETQIKIIESIIGIKLDSLKKINYVLQESTIGKERISDIGNKVVLAISPEGKIKNHIDEYKKDSIPDAWIWSDKFIILIENKTNSELYSSQLDMHRKILGSCKLINKSWKKDIYPLFKNFKTENLEAKEKFLIEEFRRYLEMVELSDFEGFEKQDFIRARAEEDEEREYVRNKFKELGVILSEELKNKNLISEHQCPNRFEWWNYFVRKSNKKYYHLAHFSIFNSDRYSSEAHMVGVKLHLQGGQDLSNLKRKIKQNPSEFTKLIKDLQKSNKPYDIAISERETYKPYKTKEGATYSVDSKYITDERIKNIINMIRDKNKIWFSIYYTFSEVEAEKLGKNIINEIIRIIDELWEIYSYIIKNH